MTPPFHLLSWIKKRRRLLKPPVGNRQFFIDSGDFIVMVVGGPNRRADYHYDEGEEFFYQLKGNIILKIIDGGKRMDIPIREGEIFLLAAKIPHSPQRGAGTVGLVVERKRRPGEKDGMIWYCEKCGEKLHEEYFPMKDIVRQIPKAIEKFMASKRLRTCSQCGTVMECV